MGEEVKFRVTYWPGTATDRKNCPCCTCCTRADNSRTAQELLDEIQKVAFLEFSSFKEALMGTAAAYIDTSDGVLIEYVNVCKTCNKEFYMKQPELTLETHHWDMCPDCAEALTLA